jgi:hypothetical protein
VEGRSELEASGSCSKQTLASRSCPGGWAAAQSSAEWIVERPEICRRSCSLSSLADFGTTSLSDAVTTTSPLTNAPIDSLSSVEIEMVDSAHTYVLALPSALGSAGDSFTETWEGSGLTGPGGNPIMAIAAVGSAVGTVV